MILGLGFSEGVVSEEVDREGLMSSSLPLTGSVFGDVLSEEVVSGVAAS